MIYEEDVMRSDYEMQVGKMGPGCTWLLAQSKCRPALSEFRRCLNSRGLPLALYVVTCSRQITW